VGDFLEPQSRGEDREKGKITMTYTAQELRSIAERYPFLPASIFELRNRKCLTIALKNLEGNSEVRDVRRDLKDSTRAFSYGAPPTRQQRTSDAEREELQWKIVQSLQTATPAVPVISDIERMRLRAIAVSTL
jgi:hypothetical protein